MQQSCEACGVSFESEGRRKSCGERCKKRLQRGGKVAPLPSRSSGLIAATERELESAGRLDTSLGQQAVALAARIEGPSPDTGSSVAALSKELRAVMEAATADVNDAADPIDELRAWRDRKRAAAR